MALRQLRHAGIEEGRIDRRLTNFFEPMLDEIVNYKMRKMKTMNMNMNTKSNRFSSACVSSCKKIMAQLNAVKQSIAREFSDTMAAHNHLLELALNEAEALAAETSYPHLFFPVLAEEKSRAVSSWTAHQQAIRRSESPRRLAA